MSRTSNTATKQSHKSSRTKTLLLALVLFCVCMGACVTVYATTVISRAPAIDTSDIYASLSQSSVLYDDEGNVYDTVSVDGGKRVNLSYEEIPEDLINAVVALEDKTFWSHHGFNIIRIFGAIKDAVFGGGQISGTSTITQQLARNIYLSDTMSVYSLNRKVTEAYYTVILERNLTKEQIIEAYLNTIYLGYNSYGVESAANSYFSKSASDLSLLECVTLASLPQAPDTYAPVKTYTAETFQSISDTIDEDYVLSQSSSYVTVYNGDVSASRRETTLNLMVQQGYITQEECDAALEDDLFDSINLSVSSTSTSNYFTSFVISQVLDDLMAEGYTESDARTLIYSGGLKIYTTLNQQAQSAIETAFADSSNFPSVSYTNNTRDSDGKIYNKDDTAILLYSKDTYLADDTFTLKSSEYEILDNGDMVLLRGNRLNFYNVTSNGASDIQIEFKPLYVINDGAFYVIESSALGVPSEYKSYDDDSNVVISAQFFIDYPEAFVANSDGTYSISSTYYTLGTEVRQPQAAMVICDNTTGAVVAMVGGRDVSGELLYNRATSTRQPGSSIKPLAVYSEALQIGADAAATSTPLTYSELDENQISEGYGDYWTAASLINDAELTINGEIWPKNSYNSYKGLITLRNAVEISCNVAAVRIFQQIGSSYSLSMLKDFGITTIVESGDSNDMNAAALALGGLTNGVSPLEMASAYTTFQAGGVHRSYSCYTQVLNSHGEVLLTQTIEETEVMDAGVAWIMSDILRTTVTNGIATSAKVSGQTTAGKTGTTTDNYDAWFCGFTAQYSAALWIGNDINLELSQGSAAAAKLWSKVMTAATKGLSGSFTSRPSNVVSSNGEYFISGTEDGVSSITATCVECEICNETGYLATPGCTDTSTAYLEEDSVEATYYCLEHNTNTTKYPVDPDLLPDEEEETPVTEPEETVSTETDPDTETP